MARRKSLEGERPKPQRAKGKKPAEKKVSEKVEDAEPKTPKRAAGKTAATRTTTRSKKTKEIAESKEIKKTNEVAADIPVIDDDIAFEMSKVEELSALIIDSAKMNGNEITYTEINAMLADNNPDKDTLEDIYDFV